MIGGGERGFLDERVLGSLAVAGVGLLAFIIVERRTSSPMLPLHFFRQRDFTAGVVIVGSVFFAVGVVFFFLTQYYQLVQGRTAFEAGLLVLPSAIAMVVGAPLSGLLIQRVGPKLLITAAVAFVAVAVALLSQLTADTSTLQIAATVALFGLAGGVGMAPLTDTVMAAVPVDDAGVGSAMNDVSRELGAALGIAAVGSLESSLYQREVSSALGPSVPQALVESLREGVGVASVVAQSLPPELQITVLTATQAAFVNAFTTGFVVLAGLLAVTTLVAAVLVPRHARTHQAMEAVVEHASPLSEGASLEERWPRRRLDQFARGIRCRRRDRRHRRSAIGREEGCG